MRISQRAHETNIKKTKIELAIHEMQTEHGLTAIEMLQVLNSAAATILKYELRYERHGNYDTPAELEPTKKKDKK